MLMQKCNLCDEYTNNKDIYDFNYKLMEYIKITF